MVVQCVFDFVCLLSVAVLDFLILLVWVERCRKIVRILRNVVQKLVSHYEEWVESKQYTVNQIDALLQSNRLSRVMTTAGRDKTQPETARFYAALQRSSLLGYVPQCRMYLFHSTEDNMVPFVNSEHLRASIPDTSRVAFDFAPYGTHAAACILFLERVYKAIE